MRMNYNNVRRDMKKLRALAEECEASAKTCTKYQNELSQYWDGKSADAYKEGLRRLNAQSQKLAQDIERAAALIQSVADDMEEEDRRIAAEIAGKKLASTSGSMSSGAAKASSGSSNAASKTAKTTTNASKAAKSSGSSAKTGNYTLEKTVSNLISRLFGKG